MTDRHESLHGHLSSSEDRSVTQVHSASETYDRLAQYLDAKADLTITLTYGQIEAVMGRKLRPYQRKYPAAWTWSNPVGFALNKAGWKASPRLRQGLVFFRRIKLRLSEHELMAKKGKYEPLFDYLSVNQEQSVRRTFIEIERILGTALPGSARRHQAWWANARTSHPYAQSWIRAGFETYDLNLGSEKVSFRRIRHTHE